MCKHPRRVPRWGGTPCYQISAGRVAVTYLIMATSCLKAVKVFGSVKLDIGLWRILIATSLPLHLPLITFPNEPTPITSNPSISVGRISGGPVACSISEENGDQLLPPNPAPFFSEFGSCRILTRNHPRTYDKEHMARQWGCIYLVMLLLIFPQRSGVLKLHHRASLQSFGVLPAWFANLEASWRSFLELSRSLFACSCLHSSAG